MLGNSLGNSGKQCPGEIGAVWDQTRKRIRRSLADILDLPGEVTLDMPRIVMLGNLRVHIENHRGITEYTGEVVRVAFPRARLR